MAVVFRLPTWNTELQLFRRTGGVWAPLTTIVGQIYTPSRGQDDVVGGLLYFMFPKSDVDVARDSFDGDADAVLVPYPGGGAAKAFRVRSISPRWLNFTNEHLIMELNRLTAAEQAAIVGGAAFQFDETAIGSFVVEPEVEPIECELVRQILNMESPPFARGTDVIPTWRATIVGLDRQWYIQVQEFPAGTLTTEITLIIMEPPTAPELIMRYQVAGVEPPLPIELPNVFNAEWGCDFSETTLTLLAP